MVVAKSLMEIVETGVANPHTKYGDEFRLISYDVYRRFTISPNAESILHLPQPVVYVKYCTANYLQLFYGRTVQLISSVIEMSR